MGLKMIHLSFLDPGKMWIVNSLSRSAALLLALSIMRFATRQISSGGQMLRWLVKLSYPIYVFHLIFVSSVSRILMFFASMTGSLFCFALRQVFLVL